MAQKPVYVTRPFLPPIKDLIPYLERIWDSAQLTNMGPIHNELERALEEFLGVEHLSLFNNGTIALLVAQKALGLTGEVITTPFTFVATSHSLLWNGLKPVFVDVEPGHLNIDPGLIEEAITENTSAILPVHVYGNPCDTQEIERIAKKHSLKVLYDGSHAFGTERDGISVLNSGDLTVLSFHATKVFNTLEGGAIISHDSDTMGLINRLKNFGFMGEDIIQEPGINGKMNELQSAIGLLQLNWLKEDYKRRESLIRLYMNGLKEFAGIRVLQPEKGVKSLHPYFPVLIDSSVCGFNRNDLTINLNRHNIYPRRYFYPLLSDLEAYRPFIKPGQDFPVARKASEEVLCLPFFASMSESTIDEILGLVRDTANKKSF